MSSLYTNDTANAYTATRGTCAPMGGNVGNYNHAQHLYAAHSTRE